MVNVPMAIVAGVARNRLQDRELRGGPARWFRRDQLVQVESPVGYRLREYTTVVPFYVSAQTTFGNFFPTGTVYDEY